MRTERSTPKENWPRVYWKELNLISPKLAQDKGIPAEAPVFVSPKQDHETPCFECGKDFGPLVYPPGGIVIPHHFHNGLRGGGIYCWNALDYSEGIYEYNWIAFLDPIGLTTFDNRNSCYRLEKANVRLHAHCTYLHDGMYEGLKEGFVAGLGQLEPLCEIHYYKYLSVVPDNLKSISERFRFQISDSGEVHFSKI